MSTIQSARDFEAVRRSHESYLAALTRLSFLHLHTVRTALDDVLRLCLAFSHAIVEHSDNVLDVPETTVQQISKAS